MSLGRFEYVLDVVNVLSFPKGSHNIPYTGLHVVDSSYNLARVEQVLEFAQDPRALPPARLGIDEDEQRVRAVRRVDLERSRPSLKVWSELPTPFPFRARLSLPRSPRWVRWRCCQTD